MPSYKLYFFLSCNIAIFLVDYKKAFFTSQEIKY